MIKNRFIGRFSISRSMINDHPVDVLRCMQNMIVLEARPDPVRDCFEYTAINSRLFDAVPIGGLCPEYKLIYDAKRDEVRTEKLL